MANRDAARIAEQPKTMRTYVITTGVIFALLVAAHIVRVTQEPHLYRDPWFLSFTVLSLALALWALRLVVRK